MPLGTIGIVGVQSRDEVEAILGMIPLGFRHQIKIGVRTRDVQNPRLLENVFVQDPHFLNILHVDRVESRQFTETMDALTRSVAGVIHGIQLDDPWVQPDTLLAYREKHPEMQIILEVGEMFFTLFPTIGDLVSTVETFEPVVDRVMVARAEDWYQLPDTQACKVFLALADQMPNLPIGLSGELSPEMIRLLSPLAREVHGMSIDARRRLLQPNGRLDLARVQVYLEATDLLFRRIL